MQLRQARAAGPRARPTCAPARSCSAQRCGVGGPDLLAVERASRSRVARRARAHAGEVRAGTAARSCRCRRRPRRGRCAARRSASAPRCRSAGSAARSAARRSSAPTPARRAPAAPRPARSARRRRGRRRRTRCGSVRPTQPRCAERAAEVGVEAEPRARPHVRRHAGERPVEKAPHLGVAGPRRRPAADCSDSGSITLALYTGPAPLSRVSGVVAVRADSRMAQGTRRLTRSD